MTMVYSLSTSVLSTNDSVTLAPWVGVFIERAVRLVVGPVCHLNDGGVDEFV
jgi:hypothetical protein